MTAVIPTMGRERHFDERGVAPSVAAPTIESPAVDRFIVVQGQEPVRVDLRAAKNSILSARIIVSAVGAFIRATAATLLVLALTPAILGYRPAVVLSGSMAPALHTADVVISEKPEGELPVGSVIEYQSDDGSRIHRIIEVTGSGYRTKGDANPTPDSSIVSASDILGVGLMVIPFIGLPQVWVEQGNWIHLSMLFVVLLTACWVAPRRWLQKDADPGRSWGVAS